MRNRVSACVFDCEFTTVETPPRRGYIEPAPSRAAVYDLGREEDRDAQRPCSTLDGIGRAAAVRRLRVERRVADLEGTPHAFRLGRPPALLDPQSRGQRPRDAAGHRPGPRPGLVG